MRTIPEAIRTAFYKQEAGYCIPCLLEITHGVAGYDNPLRLCNNTVDLDFDGETYYAFPFKYDPPDIKGEGEVVNAKLSICAVDQQIAAIIRSINPRDGAPTVRAVATFWSDESGSVVFDEIASWEFEMRNISGNQLLITAELVYETALDNEAPGDEFRPTSHPGLF